MKIFANLLLLAALAPMALAHSYSATLGGPDTDGTGFAVVTVEGTTLTYTIFAQNIGAPTAASIDGNGASIPLNVNTLTNGTTSISTEVSNAINANPSGYVVTIRNAEFPNGALQGQLTRAEGDGLRTAWMPVIGRVKGQAGTNFVTDMRILNNGGAPATVTLDYFAQNPAGNSAPTVSKTVTVAPGEQKALNDVIANPLATGDGLGGVKITSDQNVLVTARVINDLRAENKGTAGFAYDASASAETGGSLEFLANNAAFRTNIGYFNPSSSPVTATFVARRANGSILGTNTVTIPGYAMSHQAAFALVSNVSEANRTQDDFFVTWSATAPLFVYSSVTDNVTGDAVFNQ